MTTIPIIDISPFVKDAGTLANEKQKQEVAKQLYDACVDVGFFYVKGHGVPKELTDGVLDLGRKFFQLSETEKKQIAITPGVVRGYQKLGENVTKQKKDWHEGVDLYKENFIPKLDPSWRSKIPLTPDRQPYLSSLVDGKNPWPKQPTTFQSLYERYIEELLRLGAAIMRAIALGLGLPETFFEKGWISDSYWVMRVIGYPPLSEGKGVDPEVGISCGEHTDYGCLTMVNQDATPHALQIRTKTGEWINAEPIEGTFVMNIGDMMTVWTRGKFQSTLHRVIHGGNSFRVSVPFFYEPNFDAWIEPLPLPGQESGKTAEENKAGVLYGAHLLSKVSTNFRYDDEQTVTK